MEYFVKFTEKVEVLNYVLCKMEVDNEDDIREAILDGNFEVLDKWTADTLDVELDQIVEVRDNLDD